MKKQITLDYEEYEEIQKKLKVIRDLKSKLPFYTIYRNYYLRHERYDFYTSSYEGVFCLETNAEALKSIKEEFDVLNNTYTDVLKKRRILISEIYDLSLFDRIFGWGKVLKLLKDNA